MYLFFPKPPHMESSRRGSRKNMRHKNREECWTMLSSGQGWAIALMNSAVWLPVLALHMIKPMEIPAQD